MTDTLREELAKAICDGEPTLAYEQPMPCSACQHRADTILAHLSSFGLPAQAISDIRDGKAVVANIEAMTRRFLGWRLPENFNPDAGISFKAEFNEGTAWPMKHVPTGTNLFGYNQAKQMVEYILAASPYAQPSAHEGLPLTSSPP